MLTNQTVKIVIHNVLLYASFPVFLYCTAVPLSIGHFLLSGQKQTQIQLS